MRRLAAGLCFCLLLIGSASALITAPYTDLTINLPIYDEPYAGMGSYYGSLANGVKTVLWNPAGLVKFKTVEAGAVFRLKSQGISFAKQTSLEDVDFSSGGSGLDTTLYWTTDQKDLTNKSRALLAPVNTHAGASSFSFDQAIRFTDSFAIGLSARTPQVLSLDTAGTIPFTAQYSADLKGTTNTGFAIDSSGKLTYTHSIGGAPPYTYTTPNPLWSDFLTQNKNIPATAVFCSRNSLKLNSDFILTPSYKTGSVSWGINFIPVSARAVFDNSVQMIVDKGASDLHFYTPNFDPNDPADVERWTKDSNSYGASGGYNANPISIPAGQVVADGEWSGVYTGSTARLDFGTLWDVNDNFALSLVAENFLGSNLNMKGSGISYYANHRLNTATQPAIDPATGTSWQPFTGISTDFVFADGKGLYLPPEKNYELPKRLRVGVSIKKPILIAIDYEINQTPLTYMATDSSGQYFEAQLNSLNILRVGGEMRLFALPVLLKSGLGLLFKPTSDNAAVQTNINSIYKRFPALPAKFDIGLEFDMWGAKSGYAAGFDALSAINFYKLDPTYNGIGKTVYQTLYVNRDSWRFSYIASVDVQGTTASLVSKGASMSEAVKQLTLSDLKWNSAVAVSYKF